MERGRIKVMLAALAAALLLPLAARAEVTDEDFCRNGAFPSQSDFRIATVGGTAPRLYFFNDWDGCPQKGANCQTKAYVVPGDRLLLGKTHGEWTCAWYQGKKHETVGWVRNHDLAVQAEAEAADWVGKWKEYDYPGYVSISRKAGAWYVLGEAYWGIGMSTHFGEVAGELKIRGRRAHVGAAMTDDADDCGADLVRVGDFLIVHDNGRCGGVNVRFDGVYTRSR
jgi:hypothetical protein